MKRPEQLDEEPFSAADEPAFGPGEGPARAGDRLRQLGTAALMLGALGVVFGDIGTSPLYAFQAVFAASGQEVRPVASDVYGVISLIFWSVTLIVSIEFVTLIMRADNDGEGGIMALIGLVRSATPRGSRLRWALVTFGLFGVALFFGDGMITPAISVLSAVEGLEVVEPSLDSLVVPVAIGVLLALFAIQRFGTQTVGRLFGPVMLLWFTVIATAGVNRIASDPAILRALSPSYAIDFFIAHPGIAFVSLGAVVLTITGAEALYADMGHFGRRPIARAWFAVVFPALTLNYMGQGSLVVADPSASSSPFFLLLPEWSRVPMVVLATLAAIIASQAVISGAFSVARQAVRLGYLPRIAVRHTSQQRVGQVYAPAVNRILVVAVVALVIGFGSAASLASAYGVAVTGTITVDTVLFGFVVLALWRKPLWVVLLGGAVFLTVDLAFVGANVGKIAHGGWFPLAIGAVVFTVLTTWRRGMEQLTAARSEREGPLQDFAAELARMDPPVTRLPGTGVYLNARSETTPLALRSTIDRARAMPERVVVLSISTTNVPHVPPEERLTADEPALAPLRFEHVHARLGFQDAPDVPRLLASLPAVGLDPVEGGQVTYFLFRLDIVPRPGAGMASWRKRLFVALARNAASPIEYFRLPADRTLTIGFRLEI